MTDEEEYRKLLDSLTAPSATEEPKAAASAPANAARPSTAAVGEKVTAALSGKDTSAAAKFLSDPANAAALAGLGIGAWKSGASFNPLKPTFMQSNPRFNGITPTPHIALKVPPSVNPATLLPQGGASAAPESSMGRWVGSQVGEKRMLAPTTVGNITSTLSSDPTGAPAAIRKSAEGYRTLQGMNIDPNALAQTEGGISVTETPQELRARYVANPVGGTPMAPPAAESPGVLSRMGSAIGRYAPGIQTTANAIKGALPTLGYMAQGTGIGFGIGDTVARAMQGDTLGSGIAAAGTAAGALLAPGLALPAGLSAAAINYFRDHPEALAKFKSTLANPQSYQYPGEAGM